MNMNNLYRALLIVCMYVFTACQDDEATLFKTDLAINSSIVRVADKEGTTRILVYADNEWSIRFLDQDVSWAKLLSSQGKGHGEFLVSYESNENQLPRSTPILIYNNSKSDTVYLQQKGLTPTIDISDTEIMGIAGGGRMKSGIVCNIPFELVTTKIAYLSGEETEWISEVTVLDGQLKFRLERSTEDNIRSGRLRLEYTDAFGIIVADSITISQSSGFDNESGEAVMKDFNYLKYTLPAGIITDNIYMEAVVVSDKGNPNLATNLNATYATIDPTENQISVYVQDEQANSGFMLKTNSGSDNIFDRYDRVKLWLKGIELVKEVNPERYVLKGFKTEHILEKNEGDLVLPKEKHIKDLNDNYLYTFVKLKDVEIAVPSGSFSNINEGYSKRMSVYPTCIRDINGNSMYMLTNMDVPYRRDGNLVPQGSGTISGIIVHDYLLRYGGDIGRYSIRQLSREEIALNENRSDGFSSVLAEWSRYKTGESDPIAPDYGAERGAKLSHSRTVVASGPDFNGLTIAAPTINDGGFAVSQWWYNNKGESWIIEVSTLGIDKPVSLQVEGDVIVGGPRNYVVEWSDSKEENAIWNPVANYTLQDLVRSGTGTLLTQVAGHKVIDFLLPTEVLNLQMLYIRLRVINNEAGTNTADTGGVVANAAASRLGHVSLKYNK